MKKASFTMVACIISSAFLLGSSTDRLASTAPFEAAAGHDGFWEVSKDGDAVKKTTDKNEAVFYQWAMGSTLASYIPRVYDVTKVQVKEGENNKTKFVIEMENLLAKNRSERVRIMDLKLGAPYSPTDDEAKRQKMLGKYKGTTFVDHGLILAGVKILSLAEEATVSFSSWFSAAPNVETLVSKDNSKGFSKEQLIEKLQAFFEGDSVTANNSVTPVLVELQKIREAVKTSGCALQGVSLLFVIGDHESGRPSVTVKLIDFAKAKPTKENAAWADAHADFDRGLDFLLTALETFAPSKPGMPFSSSSPALSLAISRSASLQRSATTVSFLQPSSADK